LDDEIAWLEIHIYEHTSVRISNCGPAWSGRSIENITSADIRRTLVGNESNDGNDTIVAKDHSNAAQKIADWLMQTPKNKSICKEKFLEISELLTAYFRGIAVAGRPMAPLMSEYVKWRGI
jgi:hypothetical protein